MARKQIGQFPGNAARMTLGIAPQTGARRTDLAIDFSLRDYFDPLTILRMRRIMARTQWMSDTELREYQNRRLQLMIRHAARNVPYYRNLFAEHRLRIEDFACVDDLEGLPRLQRETVRTRRSAFLADDIGRLHPTTVRTSGTTGTPLECYLDRESNALEFVHYWRHWGWAGYRLGDRFAELASTHFLRRPHLDGQIADCRRLYGRLLLNSMKITAAGIGEYATALRRFRPRFLKGLPSALYHFACLLTASKAAIPPMRAVFSGGENLTPEIRSTIEQTFQCPLLDCYGHMERTVCIAQCPEGSYHILSDYGLLELVDRTPLPESGVELASALGSGLYNRAMPLLRYEIGDLIEVFKDPPRCRCGRSFPVIRGVRGRIAAAVITPEGRVESALFAIPAIVPGIAFLQFIQSRADKVEVRVVRGERYDRNSDATLHRCLNEALGSQIQVSVSYVSLEDTETDTSGKRPVIVSELTGRAAPSDPASRGT